MSQVILARGGGRFKSLTALQRRWLKRRQAIEPAIGHTKADHRMDRCWMPGATGDALHALSCALGYNIRWLMRALQARAAKAILWLLQMVGVVGEQAMGRVQGAPCRLARTVSEWLAQSVGGHHGSNVGLAVA